MAKIKAKDTKPEIFIRSLIHSHGFRFRVAYSPVVGKPDLYFTRKRVAIFIHGCYWHRHADCKYSYIPKSNTAFWLKKFNSNIRRDITVRESLLADDIRVLVVWECTIKKMMKDSNECSNILNQIISFIENEDSHYKEL